MRTYVNLPLWTLLVLSSIASIAAPLPIATGGGELRFGDNQLQVVFDVASGRIKNIQADGSIRLRQDSSRGLPFDIQEDTIWASHRKAAFIPQGISRTDDNTVRSRLQWGPWLVDAFVQLLPERRMVRRWFTMEWTDDKPTKIRSFWANAGKLTVQNDQGGYLIPARFPACERTRKDFKVGTRDHSSRSPSPVVGDDGGGHRVSWVIDELVSWADGGWHSIHQAADGFSTVVSFNCKGHVRKGQPQTLGDSWICLGDGTRHDGLAALGEWFRTVGQVPPSDRPSWLKRLTLYSLHPGGTIGSNCRDWGGFKNATAALDHIHALGCNAVWLMPLEDVSIYCPRDYYKLQAGIGTPDDYKAFTAKARALGMHVWQDCVPHGGRSVFPRAKEHPEWLAYDEQGKPLDYWCFDFNWPTWIDYMAKVVGWYTKEYGLDGFRIDAVCGSHIPNWSEKIPYARASFAQSQGGLAMQRALRKAVKAINPDGANLAEAGASIHGATSDAVYDFSLCYNVLHRFADLPPSEGVPALRRWLHEQKLSETPDLIRMRHLESHDALRASLWYGVAPMRAMEALIAWIPGIPLVYQEMEDGSFEVFRDIFHIRAENPELTDGDVDYLSPAAPAGVFACTRTLGDRVCVPVINFNATSVSGTMRVGASDVAFTLPPFGYTVLKPGQKPSSSLTKASAPRSRANTPPMPTARLLNATTLKPITFPAVLSATTNTDRSITWNVKSWGGADPSLFVLALRIPNARRWSVRTAEGDFSSPYRVRHPQFDGTIGPIYRLPQGGPCLWDSYLHPFGLNSSHGGVTVETDSGTWFLDAFASETLMGTRDERVRILERIGDDHALHLAVGGASVTLSRNRDGDTPSSSDTDGFTGDRRLRLAANGWTFENRHYRLNIRRNGSIAGYWRRQPNGTWRRTIGSAGTYTDIGYGEAKTDGNLVSRRYSQQDDVEATITFAHEEGELILGFEGELRYKQRFAKMRRPVEYRTIFHLSDAETFTIREEVRSTTEPKDGRAFLAFMASLEEIASVSFTDVTGHVRTAQGKKPYCRIMETHHDEADAPVKTIKAKLLNGNELTLSAIEYDGVIPENVFAAGSDIFFAWQACRSGEFRPWAWNAVSFEVR